MAIAAIIMIKLGYWQLDRYHQRSAVNERIDDAATRPPAPLTSTLAAPTPGQAGAVGAAPAGDLLWSRVSATGRYDREHEILARSRTAGGHVGVEVITPLRLADGTAVLVDRGWVPPAADGTAQLPTVPKPPEGEVTVIGRVHAAESRAQAPESIGGQLTVRRIAPDRLAAALPYPVYGAYLTLESQTPPADSTFVGIEPSRENSMLNAGYAAQWWLMAGLCVIGYFYLVVRERRSRLAIGSIADTPAELFASAPAEAPVSPAV